MMHTPPETGTRYTSLFPNPVLQGAEYQVPRILTDHYITLLRALRRNPREALEQFRLGDGRGQFQTRTPYGKRIELRIPKSYVEAFASTYPPKTTLPPEEHLADAYRRLLEVHYKEATLLCFELLWAFSTLVESVRFSQLQLNHLLRLQPHPTLQPYRASAALRRQTTKRLGVLFNTYINTSWDVQGHPAAFVALVPYLHHRHSKVKRTGQWSKNLHSIGTDLLLQLPEARTMRGRNRRFELLKFNHNRLVNRFFLAIYLANNFDQKRLHLLQQEVNGLRKIPHYQISPPPDPVISLTRGELCDLLGLPRKAQDLKRDANQSLIASLEALIPSTIQDFYPRKLQSYADDFEITLTAAPTTEDFAQSAQKMLLLQETGQATPAADKINPYSRNKPD